TPRRTSSRRTSSSTRCADAFTPGRASASTSSTCPRRCVRRRKRSIPTQRRTTGRTLPVRGRRAEDLLELVRSRDLELIVPADGGLVVRTPPLEHRGVAEAVALHVVVLHFAHAFDAQRLPRQILPRTPPALPARHAGRHHRGAALGPLAPRMPGDRVRA